jgi:hypothetical protein
VLRVGAKQLGHRLQAPDVLHALTNRHILQQGHRLAVRQRLRGQPLHAGRRQAPQLPIAMAAGGAGDQAAMGLDEPPQRFARAGQPLAERVVRDAGHLGRDLAFEAHHLAQQVGQPLTRLQCHQHALGAHQRQFGRGHTLLGRGRVDQHGLLGRAVDAVLDVVAQLAEAARPRAAARAQGVRQRIGRNAVDPGGEAAVAAEVLQVRGHAQQHLLGGVACVLAPAQHAQGQVHHQRFGEAQQTLQCLRITGARQPQVVFDAVGLMA